AAGCSALGAVISAPRVGVGSATAGLRRTSHAAAPAATKPMAPPTTSNDPRRLTDPAPVAAVPASVRTCDPLRASPSPLGELVAPDGGFGGGGSSTSVCG